MKSAVYLLISLSPCSWGQAEPRELAPMIVEGFRGSVLPPHFAGSATVIDEEEITETGSRSLADLLASRGGVRVTSTSGNSADGAVHLRGFGENSSSRVLILVDGRPVNRPDLEPASMLETPLSRIARIEILRGSQTARFGDNAVGGVINLVTKSAGEPRTSLEIAGGSDGYSLIRLAHDGRYSGQGITFDLERNFSDGWRENAASELESAALRWDRGFAAGNELRAGISWADEFNGFPGPLSRDEYEEDPRQSIYTQYGQADQYFSERRTLGMDAGLTLGKNTDFTIDIPLSGTLRDLSYNFGPGSHADNRLETFILTPVARWTWERGSLEIGGNLRRDDLELQQYAEIHRSTRVGNAELRREVAGVFTAAGWEPWDGWHLNAAARWEHSKIAAAARNDRFPDDPALNFSRESEEHHSAWQLGLRWEPRDDTAAWLRFDQLYRLPSTDEIASYQGFPLQVPFNDRLRAETGQNIELGAEYERDGWTLRANGFLQRLEGEIAYDYLRNLNVNFADTRRHGAELDVGYRSDCWEANLHYTTLRAEFSDGDFAGKEIYLVPRHEASAVLTFRPRSDLMVSAEYQFTGSSFEGNDFANEAEKLPSYAVANLLIRHTPKPGVSFYVRINNLLDERHATLKYSGVWYPAAGRSFQIGARREF